MVLLFKKISEETNIYIYMFKFLYQFFVSDLLFSELKRRQQHNCERCFFFRGLTCHALLCC